MNSPNVSALVMDIYDKAIFVPVFSHIKIDEVRCAGVKVSLKIDESRHLSKQGLVQSGVLAAITDVASKVAGASVGVMVGTLSLSMNLTKGISACKIIEVNSIIKLHGRGTMVIASEIKDEEDFLIATALTTMSVDGFFDEIPRRW